MVQQLFQTMITKLQTTKSFDEQLEIAIHVVVPGTTTPFPLIRTGLLKTEYFVQLGMEK